MPIGVRNKYPEDNVFIAFADDRPFVLRPWRKAEERELSINCHQNFAFLITLRKNI